MQREYPGQQESSKQDTSKVSQDQLGGLFRGHHYKRTPYGYNKRVSIWSDWSAQGEWTNTNAQEEKHKDQLNQPSIMNPNGLQKHTKHGISANRYWASHSEIAENVPVNHGQGKTAGKTVGIARKCASDPYICACYSRLDKIPSRYQESTHPSVPDKIM